MKVHRRVPLALALASCCPCGATALRMTAGAASLALVTACTSDTDRGFATDGSAPGATSSSGGSSTTGAGFATSGSSGGPQTSAAGDEGAPDAEAGGDETSEPIFDVGSRTDGSAGDDEGEVCAVVSEAAATVIQPADIFFIVDNSLSMDFEIAAVRSNLNAFSRRIENSGIDARVTLFSGSPATATYGICIDPPLGSGSCPNDSRLPDYLHVDHYVSSNLGLRYFLDGHASWRDRVRPGAAHHVVIVTDDDSEPLTASQFDAELIALDSDLSDYRFHGIVPTQYCLDAAAVGTVYMTLAAFTGGVIGNLCEQDFDPVFVELSQAVITGSGLSCEHDFPSPGGASLDPARVNLDFDDGSRIQTIGYVPDASGCAAVDDGWYYDVPEDPQRLIACPQTCDRFGQALAGRVEIRFGCATIPAG